MQIQPKYSDTLDLYPRLSHVLGHQQIAQGVFRTVQASASDLALQLATEGPIADRINASATGLLFTGTGGPNGLFAYVAPGPGAKAEIRGSGDPEIDGYWRKTGAPGVAGWERVAGLDEAYAGFESELASARAGYASIGDRIDYQSAILTFVGPVRVLNESRTIKFTNGTAIRAPNRVGAAITSGQVTVPAGAYLGLVLFKPSTSAWTIEATPQTPPAVPGPDRIVVGTVRASETDVQFTPASPVPVVGQGAVSGISMTFRGAVRIDWANRKMSFPQGRMCFLDTRKNESCAAGFITFPTGQNVISIYYDTLSDVWSSSADETPPEPSTTNQCVGSAYIDAAAWLAVLAISGSNLIVHDGTIGSETNYPVFVWKRPPYYSWADKKVYFPEGRLSTANSTKGTLMPAGEVPFSIAASRFYNVRYDVAKKEYQRVDTDEDDRALGAKRVSLPFGFFVDAVMEEVVSPLFATAGGGTGGGGASEEALHAFQRATLEKFLQVDEQLASLMAAGAGSGGSGDLTAVWKKLGPTNINANGAAQNAAIEARVAAWKDQANTNNNQAKPKLAAQPLWFEPGDYVHSTGILIETVGSHNQIRGDRGNAYLTNYAFKMQHRSGVIDGIYTTMTPDCTVRTAFEWSGPFELQNQGHFLSAEGWDFGFKAINDAFFSQNSNWLAKNCKVGVWLGGLNKQIVNVEIIQCLRGMVVTGQGNRTVNVQSGSKVIFDGRSTRPCVENYHLHPSWTTRDRRAFPLLSRLSPDAEGRARIRVNKKIDCTVTEHYAIMQAGTSLYPAECRVTLAGTAGQVDGILVGATQLLAAPIVASPSEITTATAVAAAINANVAHNFKATTKDASVYIVCPEGSFFTMNGVRVQVAVSGGLAYSQEKFCKLTYAEPHTLSLDDDVPNNGSIKFDTGVYAGIHAVAAIIDDYNVVVDMNWAGDVTGKAWRPHRLTPEHSKLFFTGTSIDDTEVVIYGVDDIDLTLVMLDTALPALAVGARFTAPDFDLVLLPRNGAANRCNDDYVIGGNFNDGLSMGSYACGIAMTRIKRSFHIDERANTAYQTDCFYIKRWGRGRANSEDNSVPISGSRKGWISEEAVPGASAGESYFAHVTPNPNKPMINGKPQLNEQRQYQTKFEWWVAGVLKLTLEENVFQLANGLRVDLVEGAVQSLRVTPNATATGRVIVRQDGDSQGGIDLRVGSAGLAVSSNADGGTSQLARIRTTGTATSYVDVVAGTTSAGPLYSANGSATDIPIRIGGKGAGGIDFTGIFRPAGFTNATKPLAATAGVRGHAWISDAPPAWKLCFVGADLIWRDSAGNALS